MDAKACPQTPPADTTTAPEQAECGSSVTKQKLKHFTDKILRKAPPPRLPSLTLPQPAVEAPKLPTRSRRIVAEALSCVPTSKQGEVLVMKRMGLLDGQTTTTAKNAYDSIFIDQLNPSHAKAT